MTRPIEAVVAEAQQRLEASGRLDVSAYVSAYPEHAAELQELLPVMLTVHREKRWRQAEENSKQFAVGLFAQLATPAEAEAAGTVGALFAQERAEAGLTVEEQARRLGMPVQSLEALSHDRTPLSALDNTVIKQLAARAAAPFAALSKEIRRLRSLISLDHMQQPGALFTRDRETSTNEEQQALRDKVREAVRKPQEPPEGQ